MIVTAPPAPPRRHSEPEPAQSVPEAASPSPRWREGLLRCMLAAAFLLFFQAYMVAPLIPYLAEQLHASRGLVGLMVPAYLLPYACAGFGYGLLADRYGRRGILFACLVLFAVCCGLTATARSVETLVVWRAATGLGAGGIAVMALTLIGDLFPWKERGRALGWLFGAIAGGSACGSTLAGILTPWVGWRGLFLGVALLSAVPLAAMLRYWPGLRTPSHLLHRSTAGEIARGYVRILRSARGRNTYAYILLNGIFHSGVFTWLGAYLFDRYRLSEAGIGIALLGYGIPGFFCGPWIGKLADRLGRGKLLPWGLLLAAGAGAALVPAIPLPVAAVAFCVLSLGLDMTHPLLAGIVTSLAPERRGQAMGLNTFALFLGFGLGSLLFGWGMQSWGFSGAMAVFVAVQLVLAALAPRVFSAEGPAATV